MAEAGSTSGLKRLRSNLSTEHTQEGQVYFDQSNKSGDNPVLFDVEAQQATQDAIMEFLERSGGHAEPVWAGEDVKYVAMRRPPSGALVCRCDSVDGSTQVNNTWMGAASVTAVEQYHGSWSRLEAFSITSMTGMTMSVENHTRRLHADQRSKDVATAPRLHRAEGEVYYADHLTSFRARIVEHLPNRHPGSLASVAYNAKRARRIQPFVEAAWKVSRELDGETLKGRFFNAAGNPIVFGLILGQLEAVIEPEHTTLHDSVYLAAHEILGGGILRLEDLAPLKYIEMYQEHATNLDGTYKPVPPYVAFVGNDIPSWIVEAHQAQNG